MATTESSASSAHPSTRKLRGTCYGCGTTTKTLTAPRPNVEHGYKGPMYCMSCNPRFFTLDMHFSCLERLGEDE
jgi:hypothetical protein